MTTEPIDDTTETGPVAERRSTARYRTRLREAEATNAALPVMAKYTRCTLKAPVCARRRATITAWSVSGDGPRSWIAHGDRAIAKPSTKSSTRDVHGAADTVDRMHRRSRSRRPDHEDSALT